MSNSNVPSIEWITIQKLAEITGLTIESIRAQIKKGKLIRGYHWVKQNGRIFISTEKYNEWITGKQPRSIRG